MCLPRPPATSPVARGGWAAKSINPEVVRPKISNLASCVHGWNARATAREVPLRQMHELQEKEGQMRHAEGQGEEERARAARLRNQPGCLPRAAGARGRAAGRSQVRKEPSTGERKEAKPSGEKGLDPKAAAQIRQLKQQLKELDTKVAGALLFCSFALALAHCL